MNTVYINGEPVGQCTSTQIRPTVAHGSLPEYDVELIEFVYDQHQPQLDENQQIVLDYLKEIAKEGVSPMLGMEFLKYELGQNEYSGFRASAVGEAFYEFNNKEEAQVLQAFSQWVLEQEED